MNEIIIGTHNSDAYIDAIDASTLSWIAGPNLIYNQNLTITEQLNAGIRAFDFDVMKENNIYVTNHGGIKLHPFNDILRIFLDFFNGTGEFALRSTDTVYFRLNPNYSISNFSDMIYDLCRDNICVDTTDNEGKNILERNINIINNNIYRIWINTTDTTIGSYKEYILSRIKKNIKQIKENNDEAVEYFIIELIYSQELKTIVIIYLFCIGVPLLVTIIVYYMKSRKYESKITSENIIKQLCVWCIIIIIIPILISFFTSNYFNSLLFNEILPEIIEEIKKTNIRRTIIYMDYINKDTADKKNPKILKFERK